MCLMMDSEVLLANLLETRGEDGVSYRDMKEYCDRIKQKLAEERGDIRHVSFDLSNQTLFDNVLRYPAVFRYSFGKYYPGKDFTKGRFEKRTPSFLIPILQAAAVCV